MIRFRPAHLLTTAAALLLVAAAPAAADTLYTATLSGALAGTPSSATGTATMILNAAETEIAYEVDYENLEGTETGAHFHNGTAGAIGVRVLTLPPGTPKVGVWAVTAYEVGELNAGRIYVNIHTTSYPSGEIRGDFEFSAVANDVSTWGAVKALFR